MVQYQTPPKTHIRPDNRTQTTLILCAVLSVLTGINTLMLLLLIYGVDHLLRLYG